MGVRITPKCCEKIQSTKCVFLVVPTGWYDDNTLAPIWVSKGKEIYYGHEMDSVVEVQFCPHCATPMPELELSNTTQKICTCIDGGYYCNTCNERLSSCKCLRPEQRWKIK